MAFSQSLKSERAQEFMVHGVNRRLGVIYRCILNIFQIFPPDQVKPLLSDDRFDVDINLHGFLINIYGAIENLALVVGYENNLIGRKSEGKIPKMQVNFFKGKFRNRLNKSLKEYLNQSAIESWYKRYAKNYRDALAHRIPPYVPPSALDDKEQQKYQAIGEKISKLYATYSFDQIDVLQSEQEKIGRANPFFIHSFTEGSKPLYLHAQLLADFSTIEELVKAVVSAHQNI